MAQTVVPGLERRLKAHLLGEVEFDAFTRGRYATDASHYQVMPLGVVAPRSVKEAEHALAIAREEGVSVLARGAGTSQAGQAVNSSLVIDCSKYLDHLIELDVSGRRCVVEPGIVLDELNRRLKPHGLWFPVDISTASRATIGGMVGNNACGARSLRYGNTRENVVSIDAVLADGTGAHFGPVARDLSDLPPTSPLPPLARDLLQLAAREADEIEARFPKVQRRVGGYNLDSLVPGRNNLNLAHILVGSEGTLAFSTRIELKLSPVLGRRAVGACHFGSFFRAMDAAQHVVKLAPIAVELVDRTMLGLARDIAMFRPTIDAVVRGDPEAVLFVEFAEDDQYHNLRRLMELKDLMGSLGFGWDKTGAKWGGVIEIFDPKLQTAITEMRTAGLNIMMSMKEEGKPVSFVEDCAVPLEHLAEYTAKLTDIFAKHGTRGTWYAHASVGCLHVRPVLNLRREHDVKAMRAIAEEAFDMVLAYKGSHSGEHGDGIVRSEFHEKMFGTRLMRAFEAVKERFDPKGLYNPGKIVRAPKFDDRRLLRYGPDYRAENIRTSLDWSAYPGVGDGFQGAVEMCNNNGACRALTGGVMCPSYRVTRDERDVTRGRANTLRLAITGQLGADALTSDDMAETLKLCVSCKACRRECPTGVDMARMKIEVQAARVAKGGLSLHDRLIGYLPRYAPLAAKWPKLANMRNDAPRLRQWSERYLGLSGRRSLPRWRANPWREPARIPGAEARPVVFFADTFNRYFEPENIEAALRVLAAAGYGVHLPEPPDGARPLCCGRTFLAVGLIDEARREAERCAAALAPFLEWGIPFVGLEPSCMLGFRDEIPALVKGEDGRRLAAHALLFEEFLAREAKAGTLRLPLQPVAKRALLHGHCHQKSFAVMPAVEAVLNLVPDLAVETVDSSCCGMAGAFGYGADTIDVSLKMAELSLLPAVRRAEADTLVVADGTSCRHQIKDGSGRDALHVARVLAMSLDASARA
ncbi:MAG TPA: FAD-linked oxidase C-terminal domain-containing protein [Xanthobacteraceae bacterium]|jgi:FAD/FMN-containing dehydrogenase/Fe-S oxidoreductase|nr:FAD-linked oxidase C-terminal domain-containing protein [Xanthobacteraceae bacterium]